MKCTSETKWKYLRESDSCSSFDPSRNTALRDYLVELFPGTCFGYQNAIKKDELPEGVKPRRFVCDAISRPMKMVVEFDGLDHYMKTQIAVNDRLRDEWFRSIGYKTVRIPYWIQLSRSVIQQLFGFSDSIMHTVKCDFCELDYSFWSPEQEKVDLNILPGNFCELGRNRFIREFNSFNKEVRLQIFNDLVECSNHVDDYLVQTVLPFSIYKHLDLNDIEEIRCKDILKFLHE